MQPEKQPTRQNSEQQRKAINTIFNEVRQRAYVLGAREREILLIQQSIQTNTRGKLEGILRDTIHEALAPIYSHRVPRFKETQIEFDPIQKRNPNPKRQQKTRLSVDPPVDRPMPRSIVPVDRAQPRAVCFQSVDRAGRPLSATVDRAVDRANLVHVVHAG